MGRKQIELWVAYIKISGQPIIYETERRQKEEGEGRCSSSALRP
jgi:hypothetical protein